MIQFHFHQAVRCDNSEKWLNAVKKEINFMEHNGVWDFVEFPKDCQRVGCNWVFKTKRDFHGLMTTLNVTRLDLLLRDLLEI